MAGLDVMPTAQDANTWPYQLYWFAWHFMASLS